MPNLWKKAGFRAPKTGWKKPPKTKPSNLWNETFKPNQVSDASRRQAMGGQSYSQGGGGGGMRAEAFGGGGSGGGGGGRRSSSSSGGSGGDGGQAAYNDFLARLAALRQQAEQRLVGERDRQFGDIGQLRHDSIRGIDTDASNTVNSVRGVYRDADRQGRQYDAQLAGLGRDIASGLSAYANPIAADLAAQGIRVTPGGLTAADAQYARALAAAQGTLSGRFNQVNAGAGADSVAGVLQTRQAGRGTAMNEAAAARSQVNNEYLQQLLALQQMGLSGST